MTLRTLEYSSRSVVYELPPGKPDPRLPCMEGVDKRPRIRQSEQKEGTCAYYAINLVRQRIGPFPTTEALRKARENEQICSLWRKKITRLELDFPIGFGSLFGERIETQMALNHAAIANHLRSGAAKSDDINAMFQAFLHQNQYELFYEYLRAEYASKSMEIHRWFLSKVSPLALQNVENQCKEERAPLVMQVKAFSNVASGCMVNSYGLAHSTWSPDAGIKALIYKLQARGPIAVFGRLGFGEYIDHPQKLSTQFADREVFGWKKDSKKLSSYVGHAVVIVGAKYEGSNEQVYYVDCNDPSDPANPSLQRIYAISYRTLVAGLSNVYGGTDLQLGFAYEWGQAFI